MSWAGCWTVENHMSETKEIVLPVVWPTRHCLGDPRSHAAPASGLTPCTQGGVSGDRSPEGRAKGWAGPGPSPLIPRDRTRTLGDGEELGHDPGACCPEPGLARASSERTPTVGWLAGHGGGPHVAVSALRLRFPHSPALVPELLP